MFNSKPRKMIITFKYPNDKCNLGDMKNFKLNSGESCERSHVKTKKTVIHCKLDQSQSVTLSGYENLPRYQSATGSSSISEKYQGAEHSLTSAWLLGHVISEIQLMSQQSKWSCAFTRPYVCTKKYLFCFKNHSMRLQFSCNYSIICWIFLGGTGGTDKIKTSIYGFNML